MILTIKCEHCGKEFESEALEKTEFCPHCGRETTIASGVISEPKTVRSPAQNWPARTLPESKMIKCADCGAPMSRRALWCPTCGSIQRSLFGLLFDIACTLGLIWFLFAVIGWLIVQLMDKLGSG